MASRKTGRSNPSVILEEQAAAYEKDMKSKKLTSFYFTKTVGDILNELLWHGFGYNPVSQSCSSRTMIFLYYLLIVASGGWLLFYSPQLYRVVTSYCNLSVSLNLAQAHLQNCCSSDAFVFLTIVCYGECCVWNSQESSSFGNIETGLAPTTMSLSLRFHFSFFLRFDLNINWSSWLITAWLDNCMHET